ncbi:MAG: hypothetical protein GF388_09855 [Candidatus Aegiribacteria sp.]|nr:hypothetical protein [Candidatus Aegiribacteria sp.]MBD3295339.1 hypothetical protein [Candidatus Fermentibacteria bacterium]
MTSSVLLRTRGLRVSSASEEPLELAVLESSMLVLLGDYDTIAPDLALIMAGHKKPPEGCVSIEIPEYQENEKEERDRVVYISYDYTPPRGLKVSEHLRLAAAAAGYRRRDTPQVLKKLCSWCGIDEIFDKEERSLTGDMVYTCSFAAACLSAPEVLVFQGPVPVSIHQLLEDLRQSGAAIIAAIPEVDQIPYAADRIALCDSSDVRATVRFQEMAEACSLLMKLKVGFIPTLPRAVMESLPGARNVVSTGGGYEFQHSVISSAVNNLVNLARANSRQIAELEVRPPSNSELLEYFTEDEEDGKADLFCGKDLDI